MSAETNPLPLDGILVLDLSRMLPGAVLARQLIDLGARVIKVEDPDLGDPMRLVPPLVGGVGVGFASFFRGAESISLDLREATDVAQFQRLSEMADVLIDSYRPGTMDRWGMCWKDLSEGNPGLVWCSLPAFGAETEVRDHVAHDLNLSAMAGVLDLVGGRVPRLQLADVTSGLLAASAILAALFSRSQTGRGMRIEQPLAAGPLPFLTWGWAEIATGEGGVLDTLLGGVCPCYRIYRCGDGLSLSLAVLEPKFWVSFIDLIEVEGLGAAAFSLGTDGERTVAAIEGALSKHPREYWLRRGIERGLPMGPVHGFAEAPGDSSFAAAGLLEWTPMPDGESRIGAGPFLPAIGETPEGPAPKLGEHTEAVLAEFGISPRGSK